MSSNINSQQDELNSAISIEVTPGQDILEGASSVDPVDPEPLEALQRALEHAKKEAEDYRDQKLRIQAELENMRKRMEREVDNVRKFALERLVVELLPIKDSLEMGLDAVNAPTVDAAKIKEGMELTLKLFDSTFEKFNVKEINPLGEVFNPQLHEAITLAESAEHPSNQVINVFQKGYQLNDRLIRSAKVIVAKAKSENLGVETAIPSSLT